MEEMIQARGHEELASPLLRGERPAGKTEATTHLTIIYHILPIYPAGINITTATHSNNDEPSTHWPFFPPSILTLIYTHEQPFLSHFFLFKYFLVWLGLVFWLGLPGFDTNFFFFLSLRSVEYAFVFLSPFITPFLIYTPPWVCLGYSFISTDFPFWVRLAIFVRYVDISGESGIRVRVWHSDQIPRSLRWGSSLPSPVYMWI